jgi:protein ImuB
MARAAGVAVKMTKIQAESCGPLLLEKRSTEQEDAAQSTLLNCAYCFSPHLESTAPGTVTIDLTGLSRLLGSAKEIGEELSRHAKTAGFTVNVGIGGNPDAALHAARGFKGLTVIAAGQETAALGCLPIEVLQPAEEILETLVHWGISNFQSLADLPQVPLTERLGQDGLYLQRLAKGETQRELIPVEKPVSFRESAELEEPLDLLEPLAFILHPLLEQVMYRLRERAFATDHVELDLMLEHHPEQQVHADSAAATITSNSQRTLKLPVPTQDAKVLLKLLQLELSAHPPEAAVRKIAIEAFPARLRAVQGGLFQPLAPEPAKLEITLARLRAVAGTEDDHGRSRVGFARTVDSHRPDSFEVLPHSFLADSRGRKQGSCQLALRMFRPALSARVEMSEGRPRTITFQHKCTRVQRAAGPWRITGAWWDASGEWQREEWDLYLNFDGAIALYRAFQDLRTGQWFVEGIYD